ncbi:MAG: aspartate--tRNA(Asn) ligase [Candidatus Obscuribacter phosphatis]|uniref:Aspartate--tRNA ligase n=1 Tax=Candidatus Obscuribacter phosphatis TaxID=1906157 RepID=A0A8J7TM68_9BACT|nr:aspartate--tRNA(Asn) ligase [Candidatus Obscuribacter phosphatis]
MIEQHGYIETIRQMGQLVFFKLRTQGKTWQLVSERPEIISASKTMLAETPVSIKGKLVQEPTEEIVLEELEILARPKSAPPVEISKNSKIENLNLETLLQYRPLTLRNTKVRAIFRVQAEIVRAFREFLQSRRFIEIHSSKLVSTGTEGGANLFQLEYFGKTAFLAQSPQFYKQIMVGVFERVFEVGPVYRAEEHDTSRHLNEYISLDFEMGFIESMQDLIAIQESLLKHIFAHLKENCPEELALYGASLPELGAIPQIELEQALFLLERQYGYTSQENDLGAEGEKLLGQYFREKEKSELVYVTNYPWSVRPFYAKKRGAGGSGSFDLLMGGMEITTGGERTHEYEELLQAMTERGLKAESFEDYLLAFKHGMPPHGGLAIGLERLTRQVLGLASVKQTSLFPRDCNRLSP